MTNKEIENNVWIAERVSTYHNYVEHVKNSITGEYLMYYVGSPNKYFSKAVFQKVKASVVANLLNENNITDIKEAVNYLNENGISASYNNIPFSLKKEILLQKDFNELVWNYGASGTKIFDEYQLSKEQKEIISSAWSEYENNNTDISEEKADEIINSYFESFINKAENNKNVELPWDENISPEMQNRIDSGEIFGTNEPVDKTENIDFSKITNPYFNLLNEEQKLAVWHDMKINVDFKGEYYDQNQDNFPNYTLVHLPDSWLVEHINHKGWDGNYPYFNLSDEHVRKHYFNDVFKEENVYFDEELLIKNIQSVKVDNTKKNYTNEIIDKIRAAGIEVVTDKDVFNRILVEENIVQKKISYESRYDIVRNKISITRNEINQLIEFKHEYAKPEELKKYTEKSYSELNVLEKKELINSLLNDDYLKYGKCFVARSKLLYDSSETLEKEFDILDKLNELGYEVYLLPYSYARDSMNCFKKSADSIVLGDFLEFKTVTSTGKYAGENTYKDGRKQAKDIFLSVKNELSESKIINNIYRYIGNLKKENKENNIENNFEGLVFINLEKKDNKTILYSFDKDGNATRYEDASYDYFKKIKGFVNESQVVENPRTEPSSSPTDNISPLSNSVNKVKTDMSFSNDTIYGFVYNGKIYLNPDFMNSNAAVHEYTHLWDAYTEKTNPELWNKGLEIFKDSKYWNEVISDPNYQDIKDDENLVLSEIHSRISGEIAERVLDRIAELDGEQIKLNAIDWNTETWYYICEVMLHKSFSDDYNINYSTGLTSADLTEFLSTPLKDLINEKNISQDINMETIQKSTKLQNKSEVYIDLDTANEIVLDEEILLNDDKSVGFYAWSTNKLVEQFIPSEKRLQLADEDNNINFYFNYFDENNINMELSFYKGDVQVYESYKVSPESKGFDKLKEKLDEYCMEQEGIHVDDYKFLNNMTKLNSKELSDYINKNTSIAFSEEYSKKILNWFETTNKPVYKTTENVFYVYHKDYDDISRNNTYPLTNTTISGLISFCMDNLDIHDEISEKEYDDLSAVRDSLEVFEDKERLDMLYQPITPEKLMEFINIAELNTFDKEMAVECIETYKSENIPLVIDELGNVYQREMSENLKSNSEDDLTMLNPSGCIDFYKNELERISANADEEWYAEHKHTIDELNEIEDYLVNLENTVQLTTDNAYILADYVNNNKEIFGKFFTKTNGHIPAFEDMSKKLAADILETLDIGDYLVRYDEQEKKFFIYDRQAAGENLFIEADAGNLLSKAADISNEWHRDDTTARENEICERLDKYLYPTESFLPIDLHINMCIPRSLSVNYEKAGNNVHKLIDEIGKTLKNTLISNTEIKEVNFKNQNDISFILKTSLVVKEPFFYENFININTVNSINENFSNSFGIALQNKFASYLGKDNSGLLENITFNKIGACEPGKNVAPSWEEIKSNFYEIDFNSARNTAYDVLHDQGIEITDYLLKQETVWQLLNDGYLTISENMDLNNDSDRAFINSAIEDVSDKYIKGDIKCHEMQYLFTEKENDYLENKEKDIVKNIPSPLDYHNPEDVQKFADFLNNNLQLSGNNSFTLEDAKFILHYDANINDKPDQLTIINGELYTHTFVGNLNNPQRDTPDTWEIYGSGKDTVLDVIDRTIDLTFDEKLSDEEQVILNKLISIDDSKHFLLEEKKEVTSSSVIETYLNKVKENLSEKDKKIVEKVLLASQKALSNFNKDEKAIIGQFFLDSGAVSQDKLGKIISKKVIEHEKQNNKSKKQNTSYEIER